MQTKLKEKAAVIVEKLKKEYPDAICSLEYKKPYELLIATRLAAQCTDARVNIVCVDLFGKYPTLESLAEADVGDIEAIVKSCGFYRMKARDIVAMTQQIIERHGGRVPDTIEELTALSGVGRKTANLILGDVYGKPAVVCDTHCIRLSNRIGLAETKDPYKLELRLREIVNPNESNDLCHRFVLHGRAVCVAGAKPKCDICAINSDCDFFGLKLKA